MDYGTLPPEVNSLRMYTGPGPGSLMAGAEAWDGLAAELYATANAYRAVISGLTAASWLGPSSASMTLAATSYASWLDRTAAQAEEAANQAKAAVLAYEEAFASTVPPPLIAANRAQFAQLVATNVLGQNTSAIAATEAQYLDMWAQDAAAMYGYAASSASATTLTPFTPPQQNTNPSGAATQEAVVGQAAAGTTTGNAQNAVASIQQSFSAVPSALQSLAAAPAASSPTDTLGTLSDLISIFVDLPADLVGIFVSVPLGVLGLVALPLDIGGYGTGVHTDDIVSGWNGEKPWPSTDPAPVRPFPAPLQNLPVGTVPPAPRVAADAGAANTVGALSVPATWTVATPAVRPVAYTLPALPAVAGQQGGTLGSSSTLGEMAVAGLAGRAIAGSLGRGGGGAEAKRSPVPQAASAADGSEAGQAHSSGGSGEPPDGTARNVVTGVAAELREFAKLRDEGILTDEEYTEQKNRLLGR